MTIHSDKPQGLHTLSFLLEEQLLKQSEFYGFKLSERFKDFLIQVELKLGKNKFNLRKLAGRTAFKLAATLHPDQVVHFHGGLSVAESNQDMWFYTLKPLDVEDMFELEAHLNEWLAKEAQTHIFNFETLPMEEWGTFEAISLNTLLDKKLFKNGHAVLEKYFLFQLSNKPCPFLEGAPQLMFHRVISESNSIVMSTPFFPDKATPYSYVVTADVTPLPNSTRHLLEFKMSIRNWVTEKPLNAFNVYFKERLTTNAYFYTPKSAQIEGEPYHVFNQIGLRKRKGVENEVYTIRSSDRYFCGQLNLSMESFLTQELTDFTFDEAQLLITLPVAAKDHDQKIGAKGNKVKTTASGVGLPEKLLIFNFIETTLAGHGLTIQKALKHVGGNNISTADTPDRIETFQRFGLQDFLLTTEEEVEFGKKEKKTTTLTKDPFVYPGKTSVTIGLFVDDVWVFKGLVGFTRALLGASQVISETNETRHYQTPQGFNLYFKAIQEPIAKELKTTVQARRKKALLTDLVKTHGLDGCFIEIGRLQKSKTDPKAFLRSTFAELGVPTQFIHPPTPAKTSIALKVDVENRTRSASKDLLAKLYFTEASLRECLDQQENPILIGISKVILDNGFHLPCLSKIEDGQVFLKLYPYETWMTASEAYQTTGDDYVANVESAWGRPKRMNPNERELWLKNQIQLNTEWLKKALNEFNPEQTSRRVTLFWDYRLEEHLVGFDLERLDEWLTELLGFELTNGSLLRWVDSIKSPTYLTVKKSGELEKAKGVYQSEYDTNLFYASGDRPSTAKKLPKTITKWSSPTEVCLVMGLHQVYVYSKDSQIKPLEEVKFMQKMRKMVLTQDIEASVPYPIYILRQLTELMDALFKYYGAVDSLEEE